MSTGILIEECYNPVIVGNKFSGFDTGVEIRRSRNATVSRNKFLDTETGVKVRHTSGLVAEDNVEGQTFLLNPITAAVRMALMNRGDS